MALKLIPLSTVSLTNLSYTQINSNTRTISGFINYFLTSNALIGSSANYTLNYGGIEKLISHKFSLLSNVLEFSYTELSPYSGLKNNPLSMSIYLIDFDKTTLMSNTATATNIPLIGDPTPPPIPTPNTIPDPPILSDVKVDNLVHNLSWSSVSNATSYTIERADSINNYSVFLSNLTSLGANITENNPNETYFYRIRAKNSIGYSNYSNVITFITFTDPPLLEWANCRFSNNVKFENHILSGKITASKTESWNQTKNPDMVLIVQVKNNNQNIDVISYPFRFDSTTTGNFTLSGNYNFNNIDVSLVLQDSAHQTYSHIISKSFINNTTIQDNLLVDTTMISQSPSAFIISNGRLKGEILFIANSTFNPFYYEKTLTSVIDILRSNGTTQNLKTNNIIFTDTQRDERILFDEFIDVNNAVIKSNVIISLSDPRKLTNEKTINAGGDPPDKPKPTDATDLGIFGKLLGLLFIGNMLKR